MAAGNAPIELAREPREQRGILICDTGERGFGLEENVRLCSLMFAYVRLCSLNGKKMFEGNVPGQGCIKLSILSPRGTSGGGPRRGETNKNAPPLPSPLLHPMEEREKSRRLMQPWSLAIQKKICLTSLVYPARMAHIPTRLPGVKGR